MEEQYRLIQGQYGSMVDVMIAALGWVAALAILAKLSRGYAKVATLELPSYERDFRS